MTPIRILISLVSHPAPPPITQRIEVRPGREKHDIIQHLVRSVRGPGRSVGSGYLFESEAADAVGSLVSAAAVGL